jgi:AcrR family transcriptional regulator
MVRALDQEKRTSILNAARSVFLRDGYAAAKMSDIAGEAGVAPGTLYLYFESKESLASAIGDDLFSRLSNEFGRIMKKLDTLEGIDALVDWALRVGIKERAILAIAKQSKPDHKAPNRAHQRFIQQLAANLEDFISRGLIRSYDDPIGLATVILAIVHRIVMSCAFYEDADPDQIKSSAALALRHILFDDAALKLRASVKPAKKATNNK